MMRLNPSQLILQARIAIVRLPMIPCAAALLFATGAAAWIWFSLAAPEQNARQETRLEAWQERALAQRRAQAAGNAAPGAAAEQNARDFYEALGDASASEQYVKTLFIIAKKTGLELAQGEYKWQFDKNSATYRYQVLLPVKGSYHAVRQFCLRSLAAMPFMSLDGLSFKREAIADNTLDASLHVTFYLRGAAPAAALLAGESPEKLPAESPAKSHSGAINP
ncbi:MAG: hypothetical protein ACHP7O_08095 [Burkholderiales bacterium]